MKPCLLFEYSDELDTVRLVQQANGTVVETGFTSLTDEPVQLYNNWKNRYPSWEAFWTHFTQDRQWYTYQAGYIHPDVRNSVRETLNRHRLYWELNPQSKPALRRWDMLLSEEWDQLFVQL